jgi:hypothetical protein
MPRRPTRTLDSEDELDESSTNNPGNIDEAKSTSDNAADVLIGTKLGSASISLELPTRQHLRLLGLGESKELVECV